VEKLTSNSSIVGIIPARFASNRLPGKPLAEIAGRPMVQHVYERACRANLLDEVLVATDSPEIAAAVEAFGGRAVMTDANHATGTDRLAEVAAALPQADVIVNIQGDEPLIDPAAIDAVAELLIQQPDCLMSSAMTALDDPSEVEDPSVVKVVTALDGSALYFSRSPIPTTHSKTPESEWRKHLGLYAYRRSFLLELTTFPPTPLEKAESLEQLRVLENGFRIAMVELSAHDSIGVDTTDDLERVRAILEARKSIG
jgi:3-deoxy-manno-octulosonate cytidylyltransferase (CMP-KDO synthetase)